MYQVVKCLVATLGFGVLIFVTGCSNDVNENKTARDNQQVEVQSTITNNAKVSSQPSEKARDKNRQSDTHQRCNNPLINQIYQQSNPTIKRQVLGCGTVVKVLRDDNDGSRHQKLLVSLDNYPNITVLIAHNIDLAPRVKDIRANTPIRFYGEYIYNDKGGVIHWTHSDPASRHQNGWLQYEGQIYQ